MSGMLDDVPPLVTDATTATFRAVPRVPRPELDASERAEIEPGRYLVLAEGDSERVVTLDPGVTHVGRGFAVDLRVEDRSVSRRHAIVVNDDDGVRVLDDRSANGTYVNGRRVTDAPLRDGDVVVFGTVAARYIDAA